MKNSSADGDGIYRDIVEQQIELIARFRLDGTITFANRSFCNLLSSQKIIADLNVNFFDILPPTERNAIFEQIHSLGPGNLFINIEHWLEMPGDQKHWIKWNFQPILDCSKVSEILGVGRDTTARVRAEEELQENEEKIKALLNAPTDTAILMTTDWKILAINHVGAKRFGKPVDELIGRFLNRYLQPEVYQYRKPKFDKVARTGKAVSFRDKRDKRVLENHVYPLFDYNGNVDRFAIFTRDITEQHKALEALKERENQLKNEADNLNEVNIALKVLLKRRDEDKSEIEEKVWFNIKEVVSPFLMKLIDSGLKDRQMVYAKSLDSSLKMITSPLARKMSLEYKGFTPMEIQVANLIQQGLTTKEIANFFNLSERTIEFHRGNIRKKLSIEGKKINLKSYLLSH